MKCMMLVCTDPAPDTDRGDDIEAWLDHAGDRWLDGNPLAPVEQATTVRVRGGELLLTDGPFAETKEVVVGYDILDCTDLDDAVDVARAHPMARLGRLELRPIVSLADLT